MTYEFKSGLGADMSDMLDFKEALGHSRSSYDENLWQFDKFCVIKYPDATELTREIVEDYSRGWDDGRPRSTNCLKTVREFGKYLSSIGKPAYVLPSKFIPQHHRETPYPITDEELRRFFLATDSLESSKNNRLLEYIVPTIFRLQLACGMRPQEVRRLECSDFDFDRNTIYITKGKKNKDRLLSVSQDVMNLCMKYDCIAKRFHPNRKYFFPSVKGNAYGSNSLTHMFHACWEMAGNSTNGKSCTPYDLRHAYATRTLMKWIEEGKDLGTYLPYLSAYMGHERFQDTFYYVHLLPERLAKMPFMDVSSIIPKVGDKDE